MCAERGIERRRNRRSCAAKPGKFALKCCAIHSKPYIAHYQSALYRLSMFSRMKREGVVAVYLRNTALK